MVPSFAGFENQIITLFSCHTNQIYKQLKKKKLICFFNMWEMDIFDDQNVVFPLQSISCGSKGGGRPYWGMDIYVCVCFPPDFRETSVENTLLPNFFLEKAQ